MPTGIPNRTTVIDVDPIQRGGLRGRLDRLQQQLSFDARAVARTLELIAIDDRQSALITFPKKMATALERHPERLRLNGNKVVARDDDDEEEQPTRKAKKKSKIVRRSPLERRTEIRAYIQKHPGCTTNQIADALGWTRNLALKFATKVAKAADKNRRGRSPINWVLRGQPITKDLKKTNGALHPQKARKQSSGWYEQPKINGKRMTLFLLEHLDESEPRTPADMAAQLASAGSPLKSLRLLNGPLAGSGTRLGHIKRTADGYRRTPKGTAHMAALRQKLEAEGMRTGTYSS